MNCKTLCAWKFTDLVISVYLDLMEGNDNSVAPPPTPLAYSLIGRRVINIKLINNLDILV